MVHKSCDLVGKGFQTARSSPSGTMQETKNVMDNNEKPTEKTKRKSERQITKDDTVSSDEEVRIGYQTCSKVFVTLE